MAKNKKEVAKQDQSLENVETAMTKAEIFIEKYKWPIVYTFGGIVLVVVAVLLFRNFYIAPRETEAQQKMVICEEYFARDSFALALQGDGTEDFLGFENIVKDYKLTKTADLAAIYAGACCYHMGEYDNAIVYLKKTDTKSINVGAAVLGLTGDCYSQKGDLKSAVKYYEKAAKIKNVLTAPVYLQKAAFVCEKEGNYAKALEYYKEIKTNYFKSMQAADVDKYIAIAEEKAQAK